VKRLAIAPAAAACLAGCSGGGDPGMTPPSAPATPAAAASVDFTSFTEVLLVSESDTATAVAVMRSQFVYRDDDNLAAFASLLPGP